MGSLAEYYIRQGGRIDDYIGPVYVGSPFVQRGHGIGSFLAGLFRMVKPVAINRLRARPYTWGADPHRHRREES